MSRRVMAARRYGKIINIGSGTAYRGIPWMLHYVTTKGGIMAMTRSMSRELGDDGIRVNTLMPGFTLSDSIVNENPGHVDTARDRAIASRALEARPAAGGSARRADLPRLGRQRLRHRADHRGRRREREYVSSLPLMPANAGIQFFRPAPGPLDSRFRGNERTARISRTKQTCGGSAMARLLALALTTCLVAPALRASSQGRRSARGLATCASSA